MSFEFQPPYVFTRVQEITPEEKGHYPEFPISTRWRPKQDAAS
jgi:hypothetical protein